MPEDRKPPSNGGSRATTDYVEQEKVPSRLRLPLLRGWDMFEITVSELQSHFSAGHFSSSDYVSFCLAHARTLNPFLEAIIETNPDAIPIAQKLDEERRQGKIRGPLHGIPVLVKDNIAPADSMYTTAGSWALLGSVVVKDAFVVSRLREAGAVVLGHSNMCEWASGRSKDESVGYSARGGQARNPYDLRKTPLGSSSGSAVSVSANIIPIAIGTETDTSVIGPAAINGIVGIKPTVGLTSRSGVIPLSENLDSVGSFGRTVADAVACLDGMVGVDGEDPTTQSSAGLGATPFLSCLQTSAALRGAKFGLPMKRCWELVPPSCRPVATSVLGAIKRAGAEIIEVELPSIEERTRVDGIWDWEHGGLGKSEWTVVRIDAYNGINAYLAQLVESPVRSIEDIVTYNIENTGTEGGLPGSIPAFPSGQERLTEIMDGKGVRDETYYSALDHIRKQTRENGIDAALSYKDPGTGETMALDALLFCDRLGVGQQYAAQAGYPIICIPIGLDTNGMPVSLSLQQSAWKEEELVKWASAVEDLWRLEHGARDIPTFKNLHAKNIPIEDID